MGSLGTKYKFPLETLGFVWGVTGADLPNFTNPDLGIKLQEILADLVGRTTGIQLFPNNPNVGTFQRTMTLSNILNYGTYVYIGLEALDGILPPDIKSLGRIIKPIALGYGIGKVFNPAAVPGNYTAAPGNMGGAYGQTTYPTLAGF